jgi:hypothetical protein
MIQATVAGILKRESLGSDNQSLAPGKRGDFTNFDALDFLERELGENHDLARGSRITFELQIIRHSSA